VNATAKQGLDFQYRLSCFAIGEFSLSSLTTERIFRDDEDTLLKLLGREDTGSGISLSSVVREAGVELLLMDLDSTPFAKIERIVRFHRTVIEKIQEAQQANIPPVEADLDETEEKYESANESTNELSVDTGIEGPYHPLSAITDTPIAILDTAEILSPVLESPLSSSPIPQLPDSPDGNNPSISSDTLLPLMIYVMIKVCAVLVLMT
jgi:hypothetical protein